MKVTGLIDTPFTPFYENGEINLHPIYRYANMLANNGLKGVFINGSSREGYETIGWKLRDNKKPIAKLITKVLNVLCLLSLLQITICLMKVMYLLPIQRMRMLR